MRSTASRQRPKRCFVSGAASMRCPLSLVRPRTSYRISNQPLHAAWGETRAEHHEVEDPDALPVLAEGPHIPRFMFVKNYSCFAYEIAQQSSQHARTLFFDREIKRITEIAWDQAVNDTANFWQSIFRHTLGPERAKQQYEIPAPSKESGNGSLC
jgi:hypothetical protein